MEHFIRKNWARLKYVILSSFNWLQFHLAPQNTIRPTKGKRTILFVGDHILPRITRLAKWLQKEKDIECLLLTAPSKADEAFDTSVFDQHHTYSTTWQLKNLVKNLNDVQVIHAFPPSNKTVRALMEMDIAPVVFDVQDLYVSNFGLKPHQLYMKIDLPNEKWCLERADLVLCQSAEVQPARKLFGIRKAPAMFFPLFCDDDNTVELTSKIGSEEFHVVYAGSVFSSQRDPKHYSNMQFHSLIEKLDGSDIHFHLYPSPHIDDIAIREYKALAEKHERFHYHEPVAQNILAKELSQYHFGLLPFFDSGTVRAKVKRRRGTSMKLFNYFEAGIPALIAKDLEYQNWMAHRYGAAITLEENDLMDLGTVIRKHDYTALQGKLFRDRDQIMISKHIPRLLKAYSDLKD